MPQLKKDTMVADRLEGNGHHTEFTPSVISTPADQTGIRPTLLIGLGGTGQRICVQLKALFVAHGGAIPRWLRLLAFDTADEAVSTRLPGGKVVSLEPGTEFVNIGQVPVGRIIRHRDRQRAIAERFGESLTRLPLTVLRHGAKQVRLLGLLALYWHFHQVEDHLQHAIWHLAGRETRRRTVVDGGQGINVFIANSLCGGTGAGTFLDVAFLVRALVEELGDLGDFCQVTGLGVLPGAFPNVSGPYLLPNTVASLMELNHAMTRNDFRATYPTGRVIEPTASPFNLYYVIDGVDERGRVWPGINAVCQLAANVFYLQMGSQLGRKGENAFDNLDEVLSGVTDDGKGTFLGSVGLSACQFDALAVVERCAQHQAVRLLQEGWLRNADKPAASRAVQEFWDTRCLSPDQLTGSLAVDNDGVPVGVDLVLPGRIRRLPLSQQVQETVSYVEDYRAARLESTFRAAIEARRRERAAALVSSLRRQINQLAGDPALGTNTATAALSELTGRLDAARAALDERSVELEAEIDHLDQELARRRATLLRAPTVGLLGRGSRVTAARREYLRAATDSYRARLSRELCQAALQVLDDLAQHQRDLEILTDQLTVRLGDAVRALTSVTPRSSDGLAVDLELAEPSYVAELYRRHAPDLDETATQCLDGAGSLLDWAEYPGTELAARARQGAAIPFEPLLQHDVEHTLREQAEVVTPEARLLWLVEWAIPSWNLDRSRLADGGAGLVSVNVLGVPNEQETLFSEHSEMLVSTHDDRRITMLRATVGAPYTALQQFPAWKRAYEQVHGERPLHVLPTFHTSSDEAFQAFALGLVFKLVFAQGSWYYYRPADRLDEPERLAQGLHNAVRAFAAHEGLAHDVLERVERHILVRLTTAQAIERLDAYWQAGEGGGATGTSDELDRYLRKAARAYADRLRQTLAATEGIVG